MVGWGQVIIKDHLSPAKLELGLSLAISANNKSNENGGRYEAYINMLLTIMSISGLLTNHQESF